MKILLCTPYVQNAKYAQGGIVVWGANIINYYNSILSKDLELIPISFDRKTYAEKHKSKISAFFNGIKELFIPTYKTIKRLSCRDVDCVHICTSLGFSLLKDYLIITVAKLFGTKSYIHVHSGRIPLVLNSRNFEHKLFVHIVRKTSCIITMNEFSFRAMVDYGVNNVCNLPNPLSLQIINQISKNESKISKDPNKVVFVGHVVPSKGIYELISSCSKLNRPNLHIIGKILDSEKEKIKAFLAKLNDTGDWITFRGELTHEKVIDELLSAEIFAFPSYSEGFPNVILEAMACKCTIVTTTVGSMPEMLLDKDRPCGICVPPRNIEAFKQALESVLKNDNLRQCISSNAYHKVYSEYTVDKVWTQLVSIWGYNIS
jgi:glycosyltransferase involved in cell wall biosynthesis